MRGTPAESVVVEGVLQDQKDSSGMGVREAATVPVTRHRTGRNPGFKGPFPSYVPQLTWRQGRRVSSDEPCMYHSRVIHSDSR